MVSIDYSLIIQIINFLLLIFILNRLLYKPMLTVLDSRKRQVEEAQTEVSSLQQGIDQKMSAYEKKLQLAKAEALAIKKELIKQGEEEAKALVDAARLEIPGIQDAFHRKTAGQIESTRKTLADNSRQISMEIAEKIMGRSLR